MALFSRICLSVTSVFLLVSFASHALAKWPHSPEEQKLVHLEDEHKGNFNNAMTTDGDGGVIVVYTVLDTNGVDYDIKAQRYDRNGNTQWPEGGIFVCNAYGSQSGFKAVSDGQGGCFIGWTDYSNIYNHVYGQHVTHAGEILWGLTGRPLVVRNYNDNFYDMIQDGDGGFIALFSIGEFGELQNYLQKWDADGIPVWPNYGRLAYGPFAEPQFLMSDGHGGAYALVTSVAPNNDRLIVLIGVNREGQPSYKILRATTSGSFADLRMVWRNDSIITATWREFDTEISAVMVDYDPANPPPAPSTYDVETFGLSPSDILIAHSAFGDPLVAVSLNNGLNIQIGRLGNAGNAQYWPSIFLPTGQKILRSLQETSEGVAILHYGVQVALDVYQSHVAAFSRSGEMLWETIISPGDQHVYLLRTNPVVDPNQSCYTVLWSTDFDKTYHTLTRLRPDGTLGGERVAGPVNLHVTGATPTQIGLAWGDAATNETEYYVSRSADGVNWSVPGVLPVNATSFLDDALLPSHNYLYGVLAYNALSDEFGWSDFVPATTAAPLPELTYDPGDLFVTGKKTKIKMLGSINIRNAGTAPSSPCVLQFHLSPEPHAGAPGDQFMFQVDVPALAPGQVVSLQPGLRPPRKPGGKRKKLKIKMPKGTVVAGKFVVGVVDWGNLVPESNEANNVYVVYGL